jgi:uncharacterized protein
MPIKHGINILIMMKINGKINVRNYLFFYGSSRHLFQKLKQIFKISSNFRKNIQMVNKLTIVRELKEYLQKEFSESVKEVILFGSQINGNSKEHSDYDILIVLDNEYNYQDENRIYDLCYDIGLKYDIIFDAHMISKRELTTLKGKQPIFTKAIKTGLYA